MASSDQLLLPHLELMSPSQPRPLSFAAAVFMASEAKVNVVVVIVEVIFVVIIIIIR